MYMGGEGLEPNIRYQMKDAARDVFANGIPAGGNAVCLLPSRLATRELSVAGDVFDQAFSSCSVKMP